MLDRTLLEKLRNEIILGSCFVNDYENSLNICPNDVYEFFNSYLNYLGELMEEDGIHDEQFWDNVDKYDNLDTLEEWYGIYDENPLPYDNVYTYMVENRIEWGNGEPYKNLRKNMQN